VCNLADALFFVYGFFSLQVRSPIPCSPSQAQTQNIPAVATTR
jgi:hypothetical protein